MPESGEGPSVHLKPAEQARLQKLAPVVMLGERGMGGLEQGDKERVSKARAKLEAGQWNQASRDLEGDSRVLGRNLRGMIDKFGIRKSDGKKDRPTDKDSAYVRSKESLAFLEPLLKADGFDKLPEDKQKEIRDELGQMFLSHPDFAPFRGLNPDQSKGLNEQQRDFIDQVLKNPNFRGKVVAGLRDIQGMHLVSEADILTAQRTYDIANKKHELATSNTGDKSPSERTQERLDALTGDDAPKTPQHQEISGLIEDARANKAHSEAEIIDLEAEKTRLETLPKDELTPIMKTKYSEVLSGIISHKKAIDRAEAEINKQINRLGTLPPAQTADLEDRLETKLEEQRGKETQASIDASGLAAEKLAAKSTLEELIEQRGQQEAEIAEALEGVFSSAATEFVQEQLQSTLDTLAEQEGGFKEAEMKPVMEALQRHLQHRWGQYQVRKPGLFKGKRREYVQNNRQVNQDFDSVIGAGNDDRLMRSVLGRLQVARPDGTTARMDEERIAALMKNKDFMDSTRDKVLTQVIARRNTVEPFRPGEMQQMLTMDIVKDRIQDALDHNQEYRTRVESLTESGDMNMDDPSFKARFSRIAATRPGLMMFPLTTIPWSIWSAIRASWQTKNRAPRQDLAEQMAA